jgi:hypothetical protein
VLAAYLAALVSGTCSSLDAAAAMAIASHDGAVFATVAGSDDEAIVRALVGLDRHGPVERRQHVPDSAHR